MKFSRISWKTTTFNSVRLMLLIEKNLSLKIQYDVSHLMFQTFDLVFQLTTGDKIATKHSKFTNPQKRMPYKCVQLKFQ